MAITLGSTSATGSTVASSTPTLTHVVNGGENLLVAALGVWYYADGGGARMSVPTASYSGSSMTLIIGSTGGSGGRMGVHVFYLANPPAGSTTIQFTYSSACFYSIAGMSFAGVDTASPYHNQAISTVGTSGTLSTTVGSSAGEVPLGGIVGMNPSQCDTGAAGMIEIVSRAQVTSGLNHIQEVHYKSAGDAASTMAWVTGGNATTFIRWVLSLNAGAAASSGALGAMWWY